MTQRRSSSRRCFRIFEISIWLVKNSSVVTAVRNELHFGVALTRDQKQLEFRRLFYVTTYVVALNPVDSITLTTVTYHALCYDTVFYSILCHMQTHLIIIIYLYTFRCDIIIVVRIVLVVVVMFR